MIKVENIEVWGFKHAVRGMRNPMNSWRKSDSIFDEEYGKTVTEIGEADLDLMKRLFKGGTEHRKYLRQIFVSMDITAPLYWWKEFDTYKVGTVANSCSTMHKIAEKEFTKDDFSFDHLQSFYATTTAMGQITMMNRLRAEYLKTKSKDAWYEMIQLLPSSYNQRRTVTMNYENVFTIIHQRTGHKLSEWREFVEILKDLPYVREIGELE